MNDKSLENAVAAGIKAFIDEKLSMFKPSNKLFMWNEKRKKFREWDKLGVTGLWRLHLEKGNFWIWDSDFNHYLYLRGCATQEEIDEGGGPSPGKVCIFVPRDFLGFMEHHKAKADHFDEWQEDDPNEGKEGSTININLPPNIKITNTEK